MVSLPLAPALAARALALAVMRVNGGPGSGNFGHAGRPGEVGGSGPGDSSALESKLKERYGVKSLVVGSGFILSDGSFVDLTHQVEHQKVMAELGSSLDDAMNAGIVRFNYDGIQVRGPISDAQAKAAVEAEGGLWRVDVDSSTGELLESIHQWFKGADQLRNRINKHYEKIRELTARYPLLSAADSQLPQLTVAVRYAFAMGRKALKAGRDAGDAVAAALRKVLPGALQRAMGAGGEVAAGELRVAYAPDQPRDDQGQWTDSGAPSRAVGQDQDIAREVIAAEKQFPHAGLTAKKAVGLEPAPKFYKGEVDGLRVRYEVPNTDSISASLGDESTWTELRGIREVKISDVGESSVAEASTLADAIRESGEIAPLIVVRDYKETYILEGQHRFAGLKSLGKKRFPAVVIVDHSELRGLEFDPSQPRNEEGKWTDGGGIAGSLFKVPADFKLEDAEYDINTKLPLNTMVFASVDSSLLSSEYQNDWRVREMAAAMKGGAKFPPLTLELHENGKLSILDGRTRVAALRELKITGKVPAVIRLFDKGVEKSLPRGVTVDDKRTVSLRNVGVRTLARKPLVMVFNAKSPRAVKWAKAHAAELVTSISDVTRERLNAVTARHQGGLIDDADFSDALADAVGDTTRAELIARTESMTAVHQGQREAWAQAEEKGLLTGDELRTWIVTEDSSACPLCLDLDGETAPLDGEYVGGYESPPAHPNCRCTEGIA